jgi:hypothetical protein
MESRFQILAWKEGVAQKVRFLPATVTLETAVQLALSIVEKLARDGAVPIIEELSPDGSTAWHNIVSSGAKSPAVWMAKTGPIRAHSITKTTFPTEWPSSTERNASEA